MGRFFNTMPALNIADLFKTGGLTMNQAGSAPMQQGPGLGYGGAKDVYKPPVVGQVKGANTWSAPAPASTGGSVPQGAQNLIQSGVDNGNNQIDSEYNNAMSQLASQEQGINAQAGTAISGIRNDYAGTESQIKNAQTQQVGDVGTQVSTAESQGRNAMQQARDLFRQTQQSNIAQLSSLGISSSSVSEALAEKLGVETARRIAGVTGSVDEVRQNATKEIGRINTYANEKLTQAKASLDNNIAIIQNSLQQGLNQINNARNAAASDKANNRANLWQKAQEAIYSAQQQATQFEQSLQMWKEQKAAALTPIVQDPNYMQNILNAAKTMNEQFSPSGFVATPSFNVNSQGTYSGQINLQKDPKKDPLANPWTTTTE
jgi:hypothetical protein